MSKSGTSISYTYDSDGMRTSKTVNGTTTKYMYYGGRLIAMDTEFGPVYFHYDGTGVMAMEVQGTMLYYVKNSQGDIVALVDTNGYPVVEYTYDTWGNILSIDGIYATTYGIYNPFRYRGYVYDDETGLYYLQTRYYNPEFSRFTCADNTSIMASILGTLTDKNLFAYCDNNPIVRIDPTGQFWQELWDAFVQTVQQARGYFAFAAGASQADSPVPGPADVASGIMLLGGLLVCGGIAIYITLTAPPPSISLSRSETKTETKTETKDIIVSENKKNPVIFPVNPNFFFPLGLKKVRRSGTKNGGFISWMDPVTNVEVFRWDENPNYSNGPHYHVFGQGHYKPGEDAVPEPLASIYFPFRL